jgi:putative transcriptional regulator
VADMTKINYPEAILKLRAKLNLSQAELGELLGVSFSSINRWENGVFEPTKLVKFKLKELLGQNGIVVEEDDING